MAPRGAWEHAEAQHRFATEEGSEKRPGRKAKGDVEAKVTKRFYFPKIGSTGGRKNERFFESAVGLRPTDESEDAKDKEKEKRLKKPKKPKASIAKKLIFELKNSS